MVNLLVIISSLRLLFLHGSGNSGSGFKNRLQKSLVSKLENDNHECIFLDGPHVKDAKNDPNGLCWWTMNDGERSYNAKELIGLEKSINKIESIENVDILIGHSQGAMVSSIILARNPERYRGAILTGAAYPTPATTTLENAKGHFPSNFHSMHAIGDLDDINPPTLARKLIEIFETEDGKNENLKIYSHPGGHIFPIDDVALTMYESLINNVIHEKKHD